MSVHKSVEKNMEQFRYYQELADESITKHLQYQNKCLVKMFCVIFQRYPWRTRQ